MDIKKIERNNIGDFVTYCVLGYDFLIREEAEDFSLFLLTTKQTRKFLEPSIKFTCIDIPNICNWAESKKRGYMFYD